MSKNFKKGDKVLIVNGTGRLRPNGEKGTVLDIIVDKYINDTSAIIELDSDNEVWRISFNYLKLFMDKYNLIQGMKFKQVKSTGEFYCPVGEFVVREFTEEYVTIERIYKFINTHDFIGKFDVTWEELNEYFELITERTVVEPTKEATTVSVNKTDNWTIKLSESNETSTTKTYKTVDFTEAFIQYKNGATLISCKGRTFKHGERIMFGATEAEIKGKWIIK